MAASCCERRMALRWLAVVCSSARSRCARSTVRNVGDLARHALSAAVASFL